MPPSSPVVGRTLPNDVRFRLAQIEQEYQAGELTQRGYEIRRSRILSPIDITNLNFINETTGRVNTSAVPTLEKKCSNLCVEWEC
jgi:DMAP1-binding Domain